MEQTKARNSEALKLHKIKEQWMILGLAAPSIFSIIAIIMIPVGWLFYLSFIGNGGDFSLVNYQRMIEYKSYARVYLITFQVSILTTLLCVLIGFPLAYFLAQLPQKIAGVLMLTVLLPFWTSLLVRTYAWLVLLQKKGLLNDFAIQIGLWEPPVKLVHNMTGTLIGMAHIMLPYLILPLYCLFYEVRFISLFPLFRAATICNFRIDIFCLH